MDPTQQPDIGGAQVLVQLSSKNKDPGSEGSKKNQHSDQKPEENNDYDETKANQQINDAVEAAVMRYVGGNLEGDDKKGKKRVHSDEIMPDFQNWTTGFLDDNIDHQDLYANQMQSPPRPTGSGNGSVQSKRKKLEASDIDPELNDLDSSSEHDQLVRAAILETRELAKQLSSFNGLNNLPAHQQHQVIVALQNNISGNGNASSTAGASAAAVAAVSNLTSGKKKNKELRDRIYKHIHPEENSEVCQKDFSHIESLDQLSEEAQKISMEWFKDQPETKGPRPFSSEEQNAVEYFIQGYCYLNKTDRKGVCNRIWTSERKKDNFWESLTKVLPYRSRASVYKHVRRQYHVFDVRGKWTPEDDEKLRKLAATKEGNWKEIGAYLGRMPEDCRDRWRNYIKCGNNRLESKWSPEEEMKLKTIVSDMVSSLRMNTINWTLVSECMDGTRSRIQCRYKWNKLVKRESVARIAYMEDDVKIWLFEKLKSMNINSQKEIDWVLLAKSLNEKFQLNDNDKWLPTDLEFGFDKLRTIVKEHRMYSFPQLLDQLIRETKRAKEQRLQLNLASNTSKENPIAYSWR